MKRIYAFGLFLMMLVGLGFTATAQSNIVEIGVSPENGATVKSLSKIILTLPCVDDSYETQLNPDQEKLGEFAILKGDETVASFQGYSEPTGDEDGNMILPIILSETITEAGEYTIYLPEGLFTQQTFSDDEDDWVAVPGGATSAEYKGKVTIDPTMKSPLEEYILTPASGSTVSEIAKITIGFPQISAAANFDTRGFTDATLTNGQTTVKADISYNREYEQTYLVMDIVPYDDATTEPAPITEGGTWTMTIEEGTFLLDNEPSPEITAKFTIGNSDEPAFPESFTVTTDPEGLEIEQIPEDDFMGWHIPYTIEVNGKCTEKTATFTIEVPEGWTNFIWQNQDISYGSKKKAQAVWESKADLIAEGYTEGNVIELPVDSRSHTYYLYLCNGDQVDTANDIQLDVMLNRHFPDLTFPETFDITLSSEGPKVEQVSEEWSCGITITGECTGETLIVTLAVPEGWDGIVGATDADMEDPDINPLSTRAEENLIFIPLEVVENGDVPLKKGNEFKFAADGKEHYGMAFLYKDDMACYKQIDMTVTVNDKMSGINIIDATDSEARYFNLQGVEVANPEKGVYVKVANGKASKVTVK